MKMPSDYEQGYERARALDPDVAANCIAHTRIGDPEADALAEQLSALEPEEAHRLIEIGTVCEPAPGTESVVLANSLLNAAPLLVGITERPARRKLVKYVYTVSRALIGKTLADQLEYPRRPTFGVLLWLRLQDRFQRVMTRLFPGRVRDSNFNKFTQLLEISTFDEAGISYRLPDSVYAEESNQW